MWPWGHAAVGYLCYVLYLHGRGQGRPADLPVLAVGLGTQAPDLVDKTLAWYLPVLPAGRSLAHSLIAVVVVSAVVYALARRRNRSDVGGAFAIGYLTHPLVDGLQAFVAGEWQFLTYLAYPLLPAPHYPGEHGLLAHLLRLEASPWIVGELVLTAAALLVWRHHGYPGLPVVRGWLRRATAPLR